LYIRTSHYEVRIKWRPLAYLCPKNLLHGSNFSVGSYYLCFEISEVIKLVFYHSIRSASGSLSFSLSFFFYTMAHCISVRRKTSQGENNRSIDFFPSHLESDFFVRCVIPYIYLHIYIPKTIITASRIYNCRETRSFINFNSIGLYLWIPFKSYVAICKFWKFHSAYCCIILENHINKFCIEHD